MIRFWLLALISLGVISCDQSQVPSETPLATAIDSFGANPNPSPLNVGVQFSWTVLGQDLVCQLDAEGDGTVDYVVQGCTSQSRVVHNYGVQGTYTARLTVSGADGKTAQSVGSVVVAAPNNPPAILVLTPSAPAGGTDPLEVRYTWTVTDPDADITHCRFDAESDGIWDYDDLCSGLQATSSVGKASTVGFSYRHKYKKPGRYEATLEAADPHISTRTKVRVRVPWNRLPAISTFKVTPGANKTAAIEFEVTDPDGDTLECMLAVESVGKFRIPDCTRGVRRYIFKEDGSYAITLVASDVLGGQASSSRRVTFGSNEKIIAEPAMALTGTSSCFLTAVGKAYCWGNNGDGQLGIGSITDEDFPTPLPVKTDARFKQIWGGGYHVCGITEAGEAYCWGDNDKGSVGDGTSGGSSDRPAPVKVLTDQRFVSIYAGESNSCGLNAEGDIYCWGSGRYGHLGQNDGNYANSSVPVQVQASGVKFTQIGMGYKHMCALSTDSKMYCWGTNQKGSVGTDSISTAYDAPQWVAQDKTFASILLGEYFTCGMTQTKQIWCWGDNASGALGTGSTDTNANYLPQQAATSHTFEKHMSGGAYSEHSCGIKADGETWCWGYDFYGNLGNGLSSSNPTPQKIENYKFSQISTGEYHTCGYTLDERLMCWGYNGYGELGNGEIDDTNDHPYPLYVNPLP